MHEETKPRWGQNRRMAFIDLRLQYDGRINRSDLIDFFNISAPQATADLKAYESLAQGNMSYDVRARVYVAQSGFQSLFGHTVATRYLDDLQRLAREVIGIDESFVGYVPPTGVVATPARGIEANEVATLVRAIRDRLALRVRYQSMDDPAPLTLVLSPHAFGFDGLRWHIRAWCHKREIFRDFAIGRLKVEDIAEEATAVDPQSDTGWTTQVPVVLVPHPKLSQDQRNIVIQDYCMREGKLVLLCRKAMLFYTLRHLNLEFPGISEHPAQQHVVIQNREEVDRWVREDRKGIVESNLVAAGRNCFLS